MKRSASFVLMFLAASTVAHGAERRELSRDVVVGTDQTVRIEIPVGEIRVEAVDGATLTADLTLECRWARDDCHRVLDDVELEVRSSERRLRIELSGLPRWHKSKLEVEGTVTVPRSAPLEIDMAVGELEIRGTEGDLWIDMGVGEVDAHVPVQAVGLVSLDVGVGEASLFGAGSRIQGRRSMLVGSEVFWDDGAGSARIHIDLGVGEITLHLE